MTPILVCILIVAGQPEDRPRLTQTQVTRLQQVVRRTQSRNTSLRAGLGDRQRQLVAAYSKFELDETRISQLHKEVIDLQRDLLNNYRDLQTELRGIVGKQQFSHFKKRIDGILEGEKKKPARRAKNSAAKQENRSSAARRPWP